MALQDCTQGAEIRERFDGLGISTDWKRFDAIASARNDVEHYYPKLNQQALQGVVASAFAIIREFLADELEAEPRELLGEPTWQAMLTVAEVYEAEKRLCLEAIDGAEWPSDAVKSGLAAVTCSDCGSDLMQPGEMSTSLDLPSADLPRLRFVAGARRIRSFSRAGRSGARDAPSSH